jgi:hypothetical protein
VFDRVTITYRGASYEIGRGQGFYGVWTTGGARSQPLERWPETPEGWTAAWSRFVSIEAPGTIVPVGKDTPPVPPAAPQEGEAPGPLGEDSGVPYTPYGQYTGYAAPVRSERPARITAAALLGAGVILGIAGLFPAYLGTASLAQQGGQLTAHAIYLAVWTVSAVLVLLGGARLRIGALLGLGLSAVTFGLFLADAATALTAPGNSGGGAGLVLSLIGWLGCAAGSVVAFLARPASTPTATAWPAELARPRGAAIGPAVMVVLAGLGVAAAFAPAWDSFTLRTAAGQVQSLTAGNAFSNPGLVIAADVVVMIAVAAVVIAAAFWRPVRHGAVLLAGATAAMAAQAISALVQVGQAPTPAQFGISSAQASQLGLTISAGVTPAFWIYFGFLVALIVSCVWMLFTPQSVPVAPGEDYGPAPDDGAYDSADDDAAGREPADSTATAAAGARDGDGQAG